MTIEEMRELSRELGDLERKLRESLCVEWGCPAGWTEAIYRAVLVPRIDKYRALEAA